MQTQKQWAQGTSRRDLTIVNLGAGVQSTTMTLMAAAGLITPMPDAAIFADTAWEPKGVYDTLRWLSKVLPFPVRICRARGDASLRQDVIDGKDSYRKRDIVTIPVRVVNPDGSVGLTTRQCTREYKVRPIQKEIRTMLGYKPRARVKYGTVVEQWFGISTDEAVRMRDSMEHWSVNRYPLIELNMSRQDCLAWLYQHYPDLKTPRSACAGCPFRSNEEWLALKQDDRTAFDDAVQIDARMREPGYVGELKGVPYIHRSCQPLDVAVEQYERDKAMNPMLWNWGDECEGMCGV